MAKAARLETVDKVTPEEVNRWMDRGDEIVFVDCRNEHDWKESKEKLPGAIRVPAGEVLKHLSEIPKRGSKQRWIVTYCT